MYVQGFGGSWLNHPFWRAKFLLTSAEDVEKVRQSGVPYVLIDDEKGCGVEASRETRQAPEPVVEAHRPSAKISTAPKPATPRSQPARPAKGEEGRSAAAERAATALVNKSKKIMKVLFDSARLGQPVRLEAAKPVVDEVVEAVFLNRSAMLKVIRLKTKDEYTYFHSVAVCTLMVNFAQHLGMPEESVRDYGLAGLLHDIGKTGVPEEILNKPGRLTEEEMDVMRFHPDHGRDLLSDIAEIPAVVMDAVGGHHEKMDGTGYPQKLAGEAIPVASRIGAICDIYDAMTSERIYKAAWTPAEAVTAMWEWEGHLDRKLLFSFMQSIGVFPVGMLVRLRSNRLGIVLDNKRRASRPRAMAFYCARQREFLEPEIVVIDDNLSADQIVSPENPLHWAFENWAELSDQLMTGKKPLAA